MNLNTMSAVMTFVSKIENDSASFYDKTVKKYPEFEETFQAWIRENAKFEKQVKQTYFGVITDTLESNFSFGGLDSGNYDLDLVLPENAGLSEGKKKAFEIEETIKRFYLEAARLSDGLMADIPRLFRKIAKKREDRILSVSSF
ncbi:MAG: hypothetical protein QF466_03590 [Desulfobacterales bacterium]|jgi:hypothetical protein|nr:hypothetical protein [Desulfobacter sp.]MDP6394520.1 hypothetical protein [Desulfobacterales bacterium]MDP6683793.1 hypothetical protein [Desulfobacterales bacterium]MDP6806182.1 hypothetical protein [Desulfobacterales bacterium]|tara:strand:- start:81911 stop:82342 length:432 start_codon:yes stop_codon:yes gene_type:complete